jgi:hypothetical protein
MLMLVPLRGGLLVCNNEGGFRKRREISKSNLTAIFKHLEKKKNRSQGLLWRQNKKTDGAKSIFGK